MSPLMPFALQRLVACVDDVNELAAPTGGLPPPPTKFSRLVNLKVACSAYFSSSLLQSAYKMHCMHVI